MMSEYDVCDHVSHLTSSLSLFAIEYCPNSLILSGAPQYHAAGMRVALQFSEEVVGRVSKGIALASSQ